MRAGTFTVITFSPENSHCIGFYDMTTAMTVIHVIFKVDNGEHNDKHHEISQRLFSDGLVSSKCEVD